MKYLLTIINLLIIGLIYAQTPNNDLNWAPFWIDNFNTFDTGKWFVFDNHIHEAEPQLYKNENVWVSDGNLIIKVNNNKSICPNSVPYQIDYCLPGQIYNYSSGWIETKQAYAIHFGYIEAHIKVPHHKGLWPAFWTLLKDGLHHEEPDHNAAEIDIFEIYAHEPTNHLETNLHHTYDYSIEPASKHLQKHDLNNFTYTDWHTYAIEWDPNKIIWYVDYSPIRISYNHGITDPIRLILNVAIENNAKYWPDTFPYFEKRMYIDYVKTYTLKCDNQTVIMEIPDFNAYDYSVKKSITLGNGTIIPTASDITLRANDFIELLPGFEVPTESELYLDVSPCRD